MLTGSILPASGTTMSDQLCSRESDRMCRRPLQRAELIGRAAHLLLDLGQPLGPERPPREPAELGQRERTDPYGFEREDRRVAVLPDDPRVNVSGVHPEFDCEQLEKPPRVE